jgi:hypothetical protein
MQARHDSEALLLVGRKKERGSETKKIPSCWKEGRKEGRKSRRKKEIKKERQTDKNCKSINPEILQSVTGCK